MSPLETVTAVLFIGILAAYFIHAEVALRRYERECRRDRAFAHLWDAGCDEMRRAAEARDAHTLATPDDWRASVEAEALTDDRLAAWVGEGSK